MNIKEIEEALEKLEKQAKELNKSLNESLNKSEEKKNDIDWIPTLLKWWQWFVWMFLSWSNVHFFLDYYHSGELGVAAWFGVLVIMTAVFFKDVTKSLILPERLSDKEQKAKNERKAEKKRNKELKKQLKKAAPISEMKTILEENGYTVTRE